MSSVDRLAMAVLAGAFLLPCGACSGRWKFVRVEHSMTGRPLHSAPGTPAVLPAGGTSPQASPNRPSHRSWDNSRTAVSAAHAQAAYGSETATAAGIFNPAPVSNQPPSASPDIAARLQSMWQQTKHNISSDHSLYYSWPGMRDLWAGVALAAPFASTSLDSDFQHWYQRDVRNSGSDDFAAFWKTFGEGQIFVPAFAGLGLAGGLLEDRPLIGTAGDFGDRVTRGYLVGAPPMLLMQFLLGGSRPGEVSVGSQWKPFDDTNAVSGHAFMGAVPFITAAKMTQNPWAKSALYICSTFTAWSRINDDDHYASQAVLGWWMAYLACRAVDGTEQQHRNVTLTPLSTPEMSGVGVVVRR